MSNIVTYAQVKESNALKNIFDQYALDKVAIGKFAAFAKDHEGVAHYFLERKSTYHREIVNQLFDETSALKSLDADYWNRVINLTEILQSMPADKRLELRDQIEKCKTPPFNPETVLNTIESLMLQRGSFMADKVDGVFKRLSGDHVTNSPMAFGQRMIIGHVLDIYRAGWNSPNSSRCEYISDLRSVIAQVLGRDIETYPRTYDDISTIIKNNKYGEWHTFDGGAFNLKVFKKGTAHLEVHPEVAIKLNEILASKYPSVIAGVNRVSKAYKQAVKTELKINTLSHGCIRILSDVLDKVRRGSSAYIDTELNKTAYIEEAEKVLLFLGGEFTGGEMYRGWKFPYDITDTLSEIVMTGIMPDKVSHQFYPTPPELAQKVFDAADFDEGQTVLEPSAGQGGLADFIPKNCEISCVEISSVNAKILKSKGYDTMEVDFLELDPIDFEKFDRIVMNPPFTKNQGIQHVYHAMDFLKEGGVLVAILPQTAISDERQLFGKHKPDLVEWSDPLEKQFPDASVSVRILKVVK